MAFIGKNQQVLTSQNKDNGHHVDFKGLPVTLFRGSQNLADIYEPDFRLLARKFLDILAKQSTARRKPLVPTKKMGRSFSAWVLALCVGWSSQVPSDHASERYASA